MGRLTTLYTGSRRARANLEIGGLTHIVLRSSVPPDGEIAFLHYVEGLGVFFDGPENKDGCRFEPGRMVRNHALERRAGGARRRAPQSAGGQEKIVPPLLAADLCLHPPSGAWT